ncbi:MAG: hypothetical protein AAGD05_18635, partial [Bacteroidota bacterium]
MNASTLITRKYCCERQALPTKWEPPSSWRLNLALFIRLAFLLFILVTLWAKPSQAQDCEGSIVLNTPLICEGTTQIQLAFSGNGTSTGNYNLILHNESTGLDFPAFTNVVEGGTLLIDVSEINNGLAGGPFGIVLTQVESSNGSCNLLSGANLSRVELTIEANPEIIASGGDTGAGNEDLICAGELSSIVLQTTMGTAVDYRITAATPLNVVGTLPVNSLLGSSSNNPVIVPTPTLNDSNLSGQIIYEITPQTTNCTGTPILVTINIEPNPLIDPLPNLLNTLCLVDLTGNNDIDFILQGPTDPSNQSVVRYRMESISGINDPNLPAAGV